MKATYRESAKEWGEAYKAHERSQTMGRALQLAQHVFEAVALAADPLEALASQREILAGAIAEFQEAARAELKAELTAQARQLVADEIRASTRALEKLAVAVQQGDHFRA